MFLSVPHKKSLFRVLNFTQSSPKLLAQAGWLDVCVGQLLNRDYKANLSPTDLAGLSFAI